MEKTFILAHDTGTGGDKAVLTDLHGRVLQSAYREYSLYYPRAGWVEQNPEELWQAVTATTREVIGRAGIDPRQILGVGISAQMFNLLPVDEDCRPLTPMLSWLDVRSVAQADRVLSGEMPGFLFQQTGNIPTAKDIIPKILWLKEEMPEVWQRTARLLDCKEYILYKLTGKIGIDWHGASVFFLFNPYQKTWSEEACRRLGIPVEMLPPTYPSTQVIGEVTEDAAAQMGLQPGTPVVICAGDVAVAQSGAGANADGKAHLCVGTATWVGLSSRVFKNDPQKPFWALNHIDPQKWIIAGEMETGGGALMWFRDTFCHEEGLLASRGGVSTYELLGNMAGSVEPGADRLIFAPWLSGERAPVLDHYARGGFIGLSMTHNKSHLARAVMEGVAYHIRWICEALEDLGFSVVTMNAIGGGSSSQLWTRIISDVTGRRLQIVEHPLEAGAMGAALTVAVGMGVYHKMEEIDDLIRIERIVEPEDKFQQRYNSMYQEYRSIYSALAPVYRQLYEVP
ncbi:MAG: FGGY-family carbohydrate kinase [Chloroflexi bacterium]|nr:FGGY-family carbohydrate kinase [Chloroflexota bacterium]